MFGGLLGSLGGSLGGFLGGGILSTIGRQLGSRLGNHLDKQWMHRKINTHRFANAKDHFHLIKAKYGASIPLVFGRMRVPGQIIWTDRVQETRNTSSSSKYFQKQITTVEKKVTHLNYFINVAFALCEGEITDIARVWWGEAEIDLSNYKFKLYKGSEDQLQDPLMQAKLKDLCPAHRGLAYIVFEKLPLADFNDMIPDLSFEVIRQSNIKKDSSVEDIVESMIMIPGSGEYVYDTKIQEKSIVTPNGVKLRNEKINCHNHYSIANSIYSLNQLQQTCPNTKWISPVSCWFGNSTNIKDCLIMPGIEYNKNDTKYSEDWRVGDYLRNNAYTISRDEFGNPNYGGSVNDASIARYLQEIKSRKLKIMFYPMFFLDVEKKPWRGRLTGDAADVKDFFRRERGYNDFILHHARLVKDHVDAFIIGSELIGLTKIKDDNGNFPAVDELINLAAQVKKIVGSNVQVSYAADWSEYHHTEGGIYNLDPLWSSEYIDFIGIDAYFPITNSIDSEINIEDIKKGFTSGEGYDYYLDSDCNKQEIPPAFAWKNIEYWWSNEHVNPNGVKTSWQPKSKPIWFTEFGFPSIDKASNKPNVFFDPKCIDGGVPTYSSGITDRQIQRKAIQAFIEFWKEQEYIGQMFLWTWDARPYPAWPHSNAWSDNNLWEKGHWVNNKFGSASLASIILEISDRCNIDIDNVKVESVDKSVEGFVLNSQISGLNAIGTLRTCHFFDIKASDKQLISFIKRGCNSNKNIDSSDCVKLSNNNFVEEIEIPRSIILNKVDIDFINKDDEYNSCYVHVNNETGYNNQTNLKLPVVLTEDEAATIGNIIIKNAESENKLIKFSIIQSNNKLQPSDYITFNHKNICYNLRIIELHTQDNICHVSAIIDNKNVYFTKLNSNVAKLEGTEKEKNTETMQLFCATEIPFNPNTKNDPFIAVYACNAPSSALYTKLSNQDGKWEKISNIEPANAIGKICSVQQNTEYNIFMQDNESKIIIESDNFEIHDIGTSQYAMVGGELITFNKVKKRQENLYEISGLTRGLMGTKQYIQKDSGVDYFMLTEYGMNYLPVQHSLKGKNIHFKLGEMQTNLQTSLHFKNISMQQLAPYIKQNEVIDNKLHLNFAWLEKNNCDWSEELPEHSIHPEYQINITSSGKTKAVKTKQTKKIIDLSNFDISAGYEISIMKQQI